MATTPKTAKSIFLEAVEKYKPDQWSVYLDGICDGDPDLRLRVEDLLKAHRESDSLLDQIDGTVDLPKGEAQPGTVIGNYKLLQQIGEGGFGVVFMAEQQQPVKRKVALKIVKPGMDTKAVIARFEAERQALAMMDHANIAKVFDGGATEHGRPYFVMELVKGVPITEYCDKNELTTQARLNVFVTVCQAVQHAHHKGVIHRDLKPSNVLVTLADVEPVVKVIDFGVAKATNQQLTERTLFTTFGQMIGTPQYMSPEQAEMNCLDVDTRSDVYSLGVLLYELLTGTTPLETQQIRTAGYAEIQRMIREEVSPKPSSRLSTSGDQLTIIAKNRKVAPDRLQAQVAGDLDWIVLKALDKDRSRRYESPSALAKDITGYLRCEPVEARRPTLAYRTAKYVRRNRSIITVALLLTIALSVGLVAAWIQRGMALDTLEELESKRDSLLAAVQEQTMILALQNDLDSSRRKLEEARVLGAGDGWYKLRQGQICLQAGDYDQARELLHEARDLLPDSTPAYSLALICQLYAGYEHDYLLRIGELKDKPAETFEDYLFKGLAQTWANPDRAVGNLKHALSINPNNAIVHLLYANALRLLAADMTDSARAYEVATTAATEALVAKTMLPKNSFAVAEYIHVHIVLANICGRLGDELADKRELHKRVALRVAVEARALPYNSMLHKAQIFCFDQFNQARTAFAEILARGPERRAASQQDSEVALLRSWVRFREDDLAGALAEIESLQGQFSYQTNVTFPALISMTMAQEAELPELRAKFAPRLETPGRDARGIFAHHDWATARLLGLDDLARQRGAKFFELLEIVEHDFTDDLLPLARYMRGDEVQPQMGMSGHRRSNRAMAEFSFLLGVDRLAEGQRSEAKRYFEQCVATDYYEFVVYWWSRAFLERLDNPRWLPWLPNDGSLESK